MTNLASNCKCGWRKCD